MKRHGARGVAVYAAFDGDVRVRTAVRRSASPNVTLASVASVYTEGRGAIASVVHGDGAAPKRRSRLKPKAALEMTESAAQRINELLQGRASGGQPAVAVALRGIGAS